MVKIIKKGKLKHQRTCSICGCVFEFEAEDVTKVTKWDDHGGHYPVTDFYKIECPFCKHDVDLNSAEFVKEEFSEMKHIDD